MPETAWAAWPSFSPAEIACRGTGAIKINTEAMDKLQSLRNLLGKSRLGGCSHKLSLQRNFLLRHFFCSSCTAQI